MKKFSKLLASCLALAAGCSAAYAEGTFDKIAFMGENIEINGHAIGWNAAAPEVVEINPATGKFEFTVRFTRENGLWQMYTDAIGENDWGALKASIYSPNIYVAFADMDPEPDDIVITAGAAERFNLKYLPDAVGKSVPVYLDPDGGFWVGGGSEATKEQVYKMEINADLSEMKIVSVEKLEVKVEYPENLYIIGDATPGGWDKATVMKNLGDGIYQYVGELKAGSPGALQIYGDDPLVCGMDSKAYGPAEPQVITSLGVSDTSLKYYETGRPATSYYTVAEGQTNEYVVTVDVVNLTINVVVNNLYFTGVPSDWNFVQMQNEGNRVFTYKGYFKAPGEAFCFTATEGWDIKVAPDADAEFGLGAFTNNTLFFGSQAAMKNVYIGYYIVSADLANGILSTRTYNPDPVEKLYVANGGKFTEMTKRSDGIYYWVGAISGDFTITPGQAAYPCYMPAEEAVAVPEEGLANGEMVFNTTADNNVNNKWSNANAGEYTIKVNPESQTISVEKGDTSGVAAIIADGEAQQAVFFDLTGRKIENPSNGIYIRVQGANAQKVVLR